MTAPFEVGVCEKDAQGWSLSVRVPDASPYFDGHFEGSPVLSAVAQFELVRQSLAVALEREVELQQLRGVKFKASIGPGAELTLQVRGEPTGPLQFKLLAQGELTTQGILEVRP